MSGFRKHTFRCIILIIFGLNTYSIVVAQETSLSFWNKIVSIEKNEGLSIAEKLFRCEKLKELFLGNRLPEDSVYARLLHRIAALQFQLNNSIATPEIIDSTTKAIQINNSGRKNVSPYFSINSYVNLAMYYETIKFYKKANAYYDSAIINNDSKKLMNPMADLCYVNKVLIGLQLGDYQSCFEDCTKGIFIAAKTGRINMLTTLYNQRAQSHLYFKKIDLAFADVDSAKKYALILNSHYELATEAKIRGLLEAEIQQYDKALLSFSRSLNYRIADGDLIQIADDYTDIGNFYLKRKLYDKAAHSYRKTIYYAQRANDAERQCKGYTNLGEIFFLKGSISNFKESEKFYRKALELYGVHQGTILNNPTLNELSSIGNTDLLLTIIGNKTELLLNFYKANLKKEYLDACINTGLLMDSAITLARYEQTGENSKLYWRNKTRSFFANILEACYWAKDASYAFYFMEKSRAVLLNDKLNETAASVKLPEDENLREQQLKLKLVEAKIGINTIDIHNADYNKYQLKYLQIKDEFERYVKTLEQKYPVYYKYKYDDETPSLTTLQQKLVKDNETFVHYFMEDSVMYILAIDGNSTKMLKSDKNEFRESDLIALLDFCADKQKLNNRYNDFVSLSNKLYNILFLKLNIPPGRVIISQDNILIPFDVLCSDDNGKRFLLYSYTFSYVYSASFLLKQTNNRRARADFIGFAPVLFKPEFKLPDLKNAAIALQKSANHYSNMTLFDNDNATRKSFLSQIADYNVVSVFSHAIADTLNNEPALFMHDSMINLSELQLLNNPATQLVMLSACQTNVGRNETGEGVYSLARGFASAGIPTVAATLWKADENAIYQISDKFNEYIAKGIRKDEALRQAKLSFVGENRSEKLLPYYWANMVLIGKSDPVQLVPLIYFPKGFWILIVALIVAASIFITKYYLTRK